MTIDNPPSATPSRETARRRLAAELRQRREQTGLTISEAAEKLEWSGAKISRIENARVSVLPRDVKFLLGIYGVHDSKEQEQLLSLARQSRQKAWWYHYGLAVPDWFRVYAALEAEAAVLRSYHPELVPALLQTAGYRQAVCRVRSGEDNDDLAALLSARQDRLAAVGVPHLHVIISEAVLRRPVGGPAVMGAQLDYLIGVGHRPGITVQLLPFSAGAHPAMDGPFTVMAFDDPADPDIAYLGSDDALRIDSEADVRFYQEAFVGLEDLALSPAASLAVISEAAEEYNPSS